MKKIALLLCVAMLGLSITGCSDDEEVTDSYETQAEESDSNAELSEEIDKYSEVYAGDYGTDYEIVLAFDWTEDEHNGLVMIIPNGKNEMEYFNVGSISGDVGEEQSISGLSEYPFTYTVTESSEDGKTIKIKVPDAECDCTLNVQDDNYLRDKCEAMGML